MDKYQIIYADPPWSYRTYRKGHGEGLAADHYDTLTTDQIAALPVADIAATDCTLFMWATYPQLPAALHVIDSWGFRYRTTAFTWIKRYKCGSYFFGLGHWTRANAEICLLATRGKPKRQSKSVSQIVDSPIQKHSRKPDVVRERIVELMGDLPRVEMFARERTDGWSVWGNEVESDIRLGLPT